MTGGPWIYDPFNGDLEFVKVYSLQLYHVKKRILRHSFDSKNCTLDA